MSLSHNVSPRLISRVVGVGNPNAPRRADAPIPDAASIAQRRSCALSRMFFADGVAGRQYESAISACRVPGLIRRLSWQRLVNAFTCAPELAYLLSGLEGKYGIRPE